MRGRFLSLFRRRRRRLDLELDDELRFHIEALEAEYVERGWSREDAQRAAQRDMGGLAQTREACRDQRGVPRLETLARDIRFGLRSLRRTPGVSAAVIATLAIGIGANTAVFSIVNGVLLKPLPYPRADALVSIAHRTPALNIDSEVPSAPYLYFTYREANRTLDGVGLWRDGSASVTGVGPPEQVQALLVTAEILPTLGVQPLLGRPFSAHDDAPGAPLTAILTYGYWQRRFGGDPRVLGRRMIVDGEARDVIGVMPAGFRFLDRRVDLMFPFQLDQSQVALGRYVFQSLARLKPGVTLDEASADLARLIPIAIERFPPPPGYAREQFARWPVTPHLRPLKEEVVGDVGRALWVLMTALGLVLLVACANVANLLLVRADGRQQELAVRAALGASWGRIAGELLVESVLLALTGGVVGLAVADEGLHLLLAFGPANLPRLSEIAIEPVVLLFALAVSLLAGVCFGLLPVVKYASPHLAAALRGGGRSMSDSRERHRARSALVVAQIAVALVLLVCSGLMIRTFQALSHVNPGFTHPEEVQLIHVAIPRTDVPDAVRATRMQNDIVDRIAAISGVASVGFADVSPLAGGTLSDTVLFVEGKTYAEGQSRPLRRFEFISPALFHTLGTPLVAGRDLTWPDLYGKRMVAVVSENLARDEWGSPAAAIGKRVREAPADPWREIVGVVGDLHDNGVDRTAPPIVYFPALLDHFWGTPTLSFGDATFVIRSPRAGSESFLHEIQGAVWSVNANLPLADIHTLADAYRRSLARTSFTLTMLALAGAMGLLLGFIGIYGVIAYGVAQRTREIGIRLALGAQAGEVKQMFVRDGMRLACAGVAIGLAGAAVLTRLMSSLLFGVSPLDPITYAAMTGVVLAVAMVAAYLPARRATLGSPLHALRHG